MNLRHISILALIATWGAGPSPAMAPPAPTSSPAPPVPGKSLPMTQGSARVTRSFPAQEIQTVVLRAGAADKAKVRTVPGRRVITVTGHPAGGAQGYHPPDPNWRETPASQWGLDFAARRHGPALVISSANEIRYIHHDYHIDDIEVEVPPGVAVIKEDRKLTGEGPPDLSPPVVKKG